MADEYIYNVDELSRDNDGSIICRCPHCQNITGLEGQEFEDVRGEQYTCRCGGMFQIDTSARRVRDPDNLKPNKGIPG